MEIEVLKNGINLITIKGTDVSPAILNIYFKVGSRYETKENNGLAHFAEHIVARKINQMHSFIKDSENYTNKEFTCFSLQLSEGDILSVVKSIKSILEEFNAQGEELEKEKNLVLSEIIREEDKFFNETDIDFLKKYYKNNSLSLDPLGKVENIKNFKAKDVKTFVKNFYTLSNMVVVMGVSEKYDSGKVQKILQEFKSDSEKNNTKIKKFFNPFKKDTLNIFSKDAKQLYLSIFKPFPTTSYENIVEWEFFSDILQEQLHNELITQKGYTYSIDVLLSKYSDFFHIFIDAEIQKDKVVDFYADLLRTIKELPKKISYKEFKLLKEESFLYLEKENNDISNIVSLIGAQSVLYGNKNIVTAENKTNILQEITMQDFKKIADTFYKSNSFVHLTGIIDKKTEKELRALIEGD